MTISHRIPHFEVEREVKTAISEVRLAHFQVDRCLDDIWTCADGYRVDLSLTPRPAGATGYDAVRGAKAHRSNLGSMFILPPSAPVIFTSEAGRSTSIVCDLRPKDVEAWLEEGLAWDRNGLERCFDVRCARVRGLMQQLLDELLHPGFAQAECIELICAHLGLLVGRSLVAARNDEPPPPSRKRLDIVEERIRNAGPAPSLSELAELCGLSVRQLTREFRATRGCSLGQYIRSQRIASAKELLAAGRSAKSISRDLGFRTPSNFTYAFRRSTGLTPSEFRKQRRH